MGTIGNKLRELRKERKLTLNHLAQEAGCTAAYISQIERDKASPSIATLKRISQVLGVRIVDFFLEESEEDPMVLDSDRWVRMSLKGWKADIRQLVRGVNTKRMQPFLTTIQPGGGTPEHYTHQGEEFGLVLEGVLTLSVGGESYQVEPFQSFYYSSLVAHSWTNEGDVPCLVVWVVSPPSW
jgi:transcriptional regulator with XRE-family HTH domain